MTGRVSDHTFTTKARSKASQKLLSNHFEHGDRREHGGRSKHCFSRGYHGLPLIFAGCGKTLLAVVASRKRCDSVSARNPTANMALGRVLRWQHSFPAACKHPAKN
jgi:hypothetical protein